MELIKFEAARIPFLRDENGFRSRGHRRCLTVMLHGTIFSATQRYNIVVTLFRMVAILFQHCEPSRVTSP